jgi:hypothetical protein
MFLAQNNLLKGSSWQEFDLSLLYARVSFFNIDQLKIEILQIHIGIHVLNLQLLQHLSWKGVLNTILIIENEW